MEKKDFNFKKQYTIEKNNSYRWLKTEIRFKMLQTISMCVLS